MPAQYNLPTHYNSQALQPYDLNQTYDIVSIGDGEMLYQVFQGIALIFKGGSIEGLVGAGFALGFLIAGFRYWTNDELNMRYILFALTIYSALYIPRVTVTIEDIYSGEVRVVANVPFGVAMPMSVISNTGVKLTELFETAFSTPGMSSMLDSGYLDTLKTLLKLRSVTFGTASSSNNLSGNLALSLNEYLENCVMFDLELTSDSHEVTKESIEKSDDLLSAIKTTFINIDTMVYTRSNPNGIQKSCKDAYVLIQNDLTSENFKIEWDNYLKGVMGLSDQSGDTATDKVTFALNSLGMDSIDSQTYMRNALISSYMRDGKTAFITRTGMEQLKIEWAGEQSIFNEIVRPLMAFIEMFTVAVSPIVAVLCSLGPMGLSLIVKYFQMNLWIALWGPVMAICNLYITIVTERAITILAQASNANGAAFGSMATQDDVSNIVGTWLSTGGMLASSVPALSLMLVYGGSVSATNLSGRMTSGATSSVTPKNLAPDPISISPSMSVGGMTEMSPNVAAKKSGMADTNFSASSTFGRASQSAVDSMRSASSSAGETLSKINQLSSRSGTMSSQASAVTSAMNRTISDGSNYSTSDGRTTSSSQKMSEQESEQVQAGVNGALKGGLGSNMIGASVQASLMSTSGTSATRAQELGDMAQHVVNSGVMGSDVTTTSSGSSNTSTNQSFQSSEEMEALGKQYQSQLQQVKQASEKYTQSSTLQDSAGKSLSMPYQDLARRLNQSGALVNINNANAELKGKMGAKDYGTLSKDAQYEINRSSASGVLGGDRDALAGFLMLNQQDPLKAAQILNDALTPTNKPTSVSISADQFKGDEQTVDGIVSNQAADGFRSQARGGDDDFDGNDGVTGNGRSRAAGGSSSRTLPSRPEQMPKSHDTKGRAQAPKAPLPTAPTKKESMQSTKSSAANVGQKASGSPSGSTALKSKVNAELGSHKNQDKFDAYPGKFKEGGHLNSDEINGTEMMKNAGSNFGNAGYDIARDTANAGNEKANALQDKLNGWGKQSVDELKNTLGFDKKNGSKSDLPNPPSDNDLPPIPK